ncbi:MAG: nucleotidyltransferase family protein [Algicola sp.]|nr:nucleotidyltransferase family protein [Algicola sp.]
MTLAILIPGAGNSSRLGQAKQLVKYQGEPLLQNRINLCALICQQLYCVLGANSKEISHKVTHPSCRFIFNDNWHKGQAYSIFFGISQLPKSISAVMILLGDQWAVTAKDLQRLKASWQRQPDKIHASSYQNTNGVPVIFPGQFFEQIKQLGEQRQSIKQLLTEHQQLLVTVPMDNAAFDLDLPEQLQQLKQ